MLDYNKCQNVVVEWNRIANGGINDVSEQALIFQRKLCEEEWKEFTEATYSSDVDSILKEYSDCIVVFSYHSYLMKELKVEGFIDAAINALYYCLTETQTYSFSEEADEIFSNVFDLVMESNYSKFPMITEIDSPDQECKDIEERSNGRYTGVTFKTVEDNEGNKRYVFKDSNGKIVKPKTYKDPVL